MIFETLLECDVLFILQKDLDRPKHLGRYSVRKCERFDTGDLFLYYKIILIIIIVGT